MINRNLKTKMHIDSRNEKLPAYLTAITDYDDGEMFLKSEQGDKFLEGHKGFLVPIPIGSTIAVSTFKIPHATNTWKGNRIIADLFTTPIKRLDTCRYNLRLQLQQLSFCFPKIDKSWLDCEIVGNSQGSPIHSRPTSIRGYFITGECRCIAPDEEVGFEVGTLDVEVCEVSPDCELTNNHDLTRTWNDFFD